MSRWPLQPPRGAGRCGLKAVGHCASRCTLGTGVSRDMLGTYAPAFLLAGVLRLVAAGSFAAVRKWQLAPAAA